MVSNHLRDAALLRRERRHTEEETGEDVKYNGVDMSHIVESRGFKILSQYRMVDSTTQRLYGSTSHELGVPVLVSSAREHTSALLARSVSCCKVHVAD